MMAKAKQQTYIKSIKRENASEQVFEQLKKLIDMQVWKPGSRIPSETQLAEQFGVSRMTIRSATQKLKNFGLLDVCQGNGSFVRARSIESYLYGPSSSEIIPSALADAFALRFYLEQAAIEFAIRYATKEDMDTLGGLLDQLLDAAAHHPEDFLDHDIAFHRYIYVMSRNQLLLTIFNIMEPVLRAQISKFDSGVSNKEELSSGRAHFHTTLYQKIANRDFEGCLKHIEWYRETSEAYM